MLNSQMRARMLGSVATLARCSAISAHGQCCDAFAFSLLHSVKQLL
jgi:hypothetical protein